MTDHVISADGARIACRVEGLADQPLVYVHGAGGDRFSHPDIKRQLAKTLRVISYDRRGRGGSTEVAPYRLSHEVDDLRAVISACESPPIVFGVSLGARIALELLRAPPAIASMLLFEPPATDVAEPAYGRHLAEIGGLLNRGDTEGAVVRNMELLHGKTQDEIDVYKSRTEEWSTRVANAGLAHREMEVVHVTDLLCPADYAAPDFPVHLLVGTETLPFIRRSADLIGALPFVNRHDLSGLNHSAPWTDPDRIMQAIEPFLPEASAKVG